MPPTAPPDLAPVATRRPAVAAASKACCDTRTPVPDEPEQPWLMDLGLYVGIMTYTEAIEAIADAGKDMRLGHDVDHVSQLIDVQFDALHADIPPWHRSGMLTRHVHGYDRTRVPYIEDDVDRMDLVVIGGTVEPALAVDDVAVVLDAAVILDFQSAFAQ